MKRVIENLKDINWTKENYSIFIKELIEEQDEKYRKFHLGILGADKTLIGIRAPRLKSIAKEISKGDWKTFVELAGSCYYEESVIKGFVIGYAKIPLNERISYIEKFIKDVDNWAVCDGCVANFKFIKKELEYFYPFVKSCVKDSNPWKIRVGLVILLDYYIEEEYLDEILTLIEGIKDESYYVKMAQAWLISIAFVKYREKTLDFIKNNSLDSWVQNKGIQKIRESLRVTKEDKDMLLKYKK